MSTILLRNEVSESQLQQLSTEFPRCRFLVDDATTPLEESAWGKIEILFGDKLSKSERERASLLRWIHTPSPYLTGIHLGEKDYSGDLLTTNTKGENLTQTGEFIESVLLAFSKRLFHWHTLHLEGHSPWEVPADPEPWKLEGKRLLQIGLGIVGGEVTRRAVDLGMRVWGVSRSLSFHPYCSRVYPLRDLPTLLRAADVVCISLPRGERYHPWLQKEELSCLKEDSILLIVGAEGTVDLTALGEAAKEGKFRGILIDTLASPSLLPKRSPLLSAPDVLITPNVASYPRQQEQLAFRTFRYNLRQFIHGNYLEMRNRVISGKDE